MFYVSYELTMPNRASWNGRWSGENEKYFIVKRFGYNFEKLKVKQESGHIKLIGFCVESVVGTFITASVTDGVRM